MTRTYKKKQFEWDYKLPSYLCIKHCVLPYLIRPCVFTMPFLIPLRCHSRLLEKDTQKKVVFQCEHSWKDFSEWHPVRPIMKHHGIKTKYSFFIVLLSSGKICHIDPVISMICLYAECGFLFYGLWNHIYSKQSG